MATTVAKNNLNHYDGSGNLTHLHCTLLFCLSQHYRCHRGWLLTILNLFLVLTFTNPKNSSDGNITILVQDLYDNK
jgi:hypothetical protein